MSLLDTIYAGLGGPGGTYAGTTYDLVPGNSLLRVLQTPDLWGTRPDSTGYYTGATRPGEDLLTSLRSMVQSANSVVDIATLAPFPDGAFLTAIRHGLLNRTHPASPLLVRIHAGRPPLVNDAMSSRAAVERFLLAVTDGLPPNAPLTVAVSTATTSVLHASWNNAKVVAADGQQVLFGGHNLWAGDYLGFAPVHDLSLLVAGAAAASAHTFCDQLWAYVGKWHDSANPTMNVSSMVWAFGEITSGLPPARPPVKPVAAGALRALTVARMGVNVMPEAPDGTDQASNLAKVAAFRAANVSIKISQQDLAFPRAGAAGEYASLADSMDGRVIAALGQALERGVRVDIVVSGEHARSAMGNRYANMGGAATKVALIDWFRHVDGMAGARLDAVVSRLRVAELHTVATDFNPWKQSLVELVQANHAKMYAVDDAVVYVGSDNLYPCSLLDFGMLIEDASAVHDLLASYWDKLWANAHPVP